MILEDGLVYSKPDKVFSRIDSYMPTILLAKPFFGLKIKEENTNTFQVNIRPHEFG